MLCQNKRGEAVRAGCTQAAKDGAPLLVRTAKESAVAFRDSIQHIKHPLVYAARHGFAHIERIRDLERTVSAWGQQLAASDLSVRQRELLHDFQAVFQGYDGKSTPDKVHVVQQAIALLDQLERAESEPSATASDSPRPPIVRHADDTMPVGPERPPTPAPDSSGEPAPVPAPGPPPSFRSEAEPQAVNVEELTRPIQFVKGVGPGRAKLLNKVGIYTVQDAIFTFPRRYEDRRQIARIAYLRPGDAFQTVYGVVKIGDVTTTSQQRKKIFELIIGDSTGTLSAKWFNQVFLKKIFKPGMQVVLSGKVSVNRYGGVEMIQPEYEILDQAEPDEERLHTGRITPIYPLTDKLYQKDMRKVMKQVIDTYAALVEEELPDDMLSRNHLMPLSQAISRLHFPDQADDVTLLNRETSPAHRRVIFEEFFLLELGMGLKRQHMMTHEKGIAFCFDGALERRLRQRLPFALTAAQNRVIAEIQADMRSEHPMNRLLQGDVGSGKTLVALAALLSAIEAGYQCALMVPTEILAEQHYQKIEEFLQHLNTAPDEAHPIKSCLLSGGLKKKTRDDLLAHLERGDIHLVVGTHALIQHDVTFHRLGFIVIDEQHKFGVMQRATLKAKGYQPDVLIMTATPIPRTLSLTVYGDLDVSILDELPPGRTPVTTKRFYDKNRPMAYQLIAREIERGRQAYIVYPLVEESEKLDLKAATEMSEHLAADVFPNYRVGLVHGRLKAEDKERQMSAFKAHELDILVSTTVLEVGIDVPNATVMLIEHAERFGLSQLHQLRGRVGRGSKQSYCLLMTAYPISNDARRRLDAMVESTDGFLIAERDLEIRGPGEFFGTKQSGLPDLRMANLVRDVQILERARREAFALLRADPKLDFPHHRAIRAALEHRWKKSLDLISIG
jgi:ATP-dependent DNA helicase RecG